MYWPSLRWLSVLLCTCCAAAPTAPPPAAPSALQNAELPTFQRSPLRGEALDTRQWSGHVVVLKFFARHCVPCQRTLPAAEALHRQHPEVVLVGVSEDEGQADAEEQVRRYGLTFPVVLDRGSVLAGRFRVTELPITFVADRTGRIAWVGGPDQHDEDLRHAVEWVSR